MSAATTSNTHLHRSGAFVKILLGNIAVSFGWWFSFVGLSGQFIFSDRTGVLSLVGITIVGLVPSILVSPISGVIADRFDRRRLMIATQLCSAAVAASFLLLETIVATYVAFFCLVVLAEVFKPAQRAMLTECVSASKLLRANVVLKLTSMIAPGIAGIVLAAFTNTVLFVSIAVLYLATGLALIGLPNSTVESNTSVTFAGQFQGGVRYFFVNPILLVVTGASIVGYGTIDAYKTFLPLYVRDILIMGEAAYGVLTAVTAVGAFIGGIAVSKYDSRINEPLALIVILPVSGFCFLALVGTPHYLIVAIPTLILGSGIAIVVSCGTTVVQRYGGEEFTGRLIGLYRSSKQLGQMLVMVVMGVLTDSMGVSLVFVGVGAVLILTGVGSLAVLSMWNDGFRDVRATPRSQQSPDSD